MFLWVFCPHFKINKYSVTALDSELIIVVKIRLQLFCHISIQQLSLTELFNISHNKSKLTVFLSRERKLHVHKL